MTPCPLCEYGQRCLIPSPALPAVPAAAATLSLNLTAAAPKLNSDPKSPSRVVQPARHRVPSEREDGIFEGLGHERLGPTYSGDGG